MLKWILAVMAVTWVACFVFIVYNICHAEYIDDLYNDDGP